MGVYIYTGNLYYTVDRKRFILMVRKKNAISQEVLGFFPL